MFLSEWREFPSAPCLAGKKNLMTARVSMLLKSRASLTFFRACFLPGRAKDLSAPRYIRIWSNALMGTLTDPHALHTAGIMLSRLVIISFLINALQVLSTLNGCLKI